MKNWIVNNFWIKIISLILAIISWFYVNGELNKESQLSKKFYKSSLMQHPSQTQPFVSVEGNKGYIMEKK